MERMIQAPPLCVRISEPLNKMRNHVLSFASIAACSLIACAAPSAANTSAEETAAMSPATAPQDPSGLSTAYFGAGCFWVEEAMFEDLKGVSKVYSGYCGGTTPDPDYEMVSSGSTGHAESVKVVYDPKVISYGTLLKVFFGSQDPTQLNGQGPDEGTQYRSVVFYQNADEKAQAEKIIAELNASGQFNRKIATQVAPFQKFWQAEDYHQGYEKLHPDQPYVATVSKRRYDAFAEKFRELLK